jgi:hypothetical protein
MKRCPAVHSPAPQTGGCGHELICPLGWVEHYPKIDEEGRKLLPIKRVSFLDIET